MSHSPDYLKWWCWRCTDSDEPAAGTERFIIGNSGIGDSMVRSAVVIYAAALDTRLISSHMNTVEDERAAIYENAAAGTCKSR